MQFAAGVESHGLYSAKLDIYAQDRVSKICELNIFQKSWNTNFFQSECWVYYHEKHAVDGKSKIRYGRLSFTCMVQGIK